MEEWIFKTIYSNYLDNADTEILMFFTKKEWSYPRKIEKSKILGTILELPANQHNQSSLLSIKEGRIGFPN